MSEVRGAGRAAGAVVAIVLAWMAAGTAAAQSTGGVRG
jgi:hypothetical protein